MSIALANQSDDMNHVININTILDQLCDKQFAIIDDFMPTAQYEELFKLAKQYHSDGYFHAAQVGRKQDKSQVISVRNDQICWLDAQQSTPCIQAYFAIMQDIIKSVNKALYLGLSDLEMHFAIYQPGDFYRQHIDQFKNTKERQISCVYYLNQSWQDADAGELVLYDQDNQALCTVAPKGNRFVCFMSNMPHEVNLTHKTRYSLTGWLKTRPYQ